MIAELRHDGTLFVACWFHTMGLAFEQVLLRGVLMGLRQERSAMEASVTELKGSVDKLDARVSALDHKLESLEQKIDTKFDTLELRLSARLDLAKAEIISEIRRNNLDLRRAMDNQLKLVGVLGALIIALTLIKKLA